MIIYVTRRGKSGKMIRKFLTHRIITMHSKISRRALVKGGLVAGAFIPAIGFLAEGAAAAGLPPLDPQDPTAKALGFVADAKSVDASANPTYKPNQKCGTCAQFQGKAGDATAGCNIFAGKSVPASGWCKVWAQKPGA
jgi:High potential iron-sulfur protein